MDKRGIVWSVLGIFLLILSLTFWNFWTISERKVEDLQRKLQIEKYTFRPSQQFPDSQPQESLKRKIEELIEENASLKQMLAESNKQKIDQNSDILKKRELQIIQGLYPEYFEKELGLAAATQKRIEIINANIDDVFTAKDLSLPNIDLILIGAEATRMLRIAYDYEAQERIDLITKYNKTADDYNSLVESIRIIVKDNPALSRLAQNLKTLDRESYPE